LDHIKRLLLSERGEGKKNKTKKVVKERKTKKTKTKRTNRATFFIFHCVFICGG